MSEQEMLQRAYAAVLRGDYAERDRWLAEIEAEQRASRVARVAGYQRVRTPAGVEVQVPVRGGKG